MAKVNKDAGSGKFVSKETAKKNPKTTVTQTVKKAPKSVTEAPAKVAAVVEVAPTPVSPMMRVDNVFYETAGGKVVKHWRVDQVHCTEEVNEVPEGAVPATKEEVFAELF